MPYALVSQRISGYKATLNLEISFSFMTFRQKNQNNKNLKRPTLKYLRGALLEIHAEHAVTSGEIFRCCGQYLW